MRQAHYIYHHSDRSWQQSLVTSWQLYYLRQFIDKGAVKFCYRKMDGTIRTAFGAKYTGSFKGSVRREKPLNVFCYYDKMKCAHRSFRIENFVGISNCWSYEK